MISINLMPARRQQDRLKRAYIQRWGMGGVAYCFVTLIVCVIVRITAVGPNPDRDYDLDEARQSVHSLNAAIGAIEIEIEQGQSMLAATQDLANNPDWGLLLGFVGKMVSGDLVLKEYQLQDATPQAPVINQATDAQDRSIGAFQFVVKGWGRTQAAVTDFTVKLERTGLFENVKLLDSNLQPLGSGSAVSFTIQCTMRDSQGAGQ